MLPVSLKHSPAEYRTPLRRTGAARLEGGRVEEIYRESLHERLR